MRLIIDKKQKAALLDALGFELVSESKNCNEYRIKTTSGCFILYEYENERYSLSVEIKNKEIKEAHAYKCRTVKELSFLLFNGFWGGDIINEKLSLP